MNALYVPNRHPKGFTMWIPLQESVVPPTGTEIIFANFSDRRGSQSGPVTNWGGIFTDSMKAKWTHFCRRIQ